MSQLPPTLHTSRGAWYSSFGKALDKGIPHLPASVAQYVKWYQEHVAIYHTLGSQYRLASFGPIVSRKFQLSAPAITNNFHCVYCCYFFSWNLNNNFRDLDNIMWQSLLIMFFDCLRITSLHHYYQPGNTCFTQRRDKIDLHNDWFLYSRLTSSSVSEETLLLGYSHCSCLELFLADIVNHPKRTSLFPMWNF